jgi:hypothetical protein
MLFQGTLQSVLAGIYPLQWTVCIHPQAAAHPGRHDQGIEAGIFNDFSGRSELLPGAFSAIVFVGGVLTLIHHDIVCI